MHCYEPYNSLSSLKYWLVKWHEIIKDTWSNSLHNQHDTFVIYWDYYNVLSLFSKYVPSIYDFDLYKDPLGKKGQLLMSWFSLKRENPFVQIMWTYVQIISVRIWSLSFENNKFLLEQCFNDFLFFIRYWVYLPKISKPLQVVDLLRLLETAEWVICSSWTLI